MRGSLFSNDIRSEGASAIAGALHHVPLLTKLSYVVGGDQFALCCAGAMCRVTVTALQWSVLRGMCIAMGQEVWGAQCLVGGIVGWGRVVRAWVAIDT